MDAEVDEFERLRRLIPERPDFHLHNWGLWRRSDVIAEGYEDHSTCLENMGGCAALESSDHLYERNYGYWAETSDSCIRGLALRDRLVISSIYESSAIKLMRFRDEELVAAADRFWEKAKKWLD